MATLILPLSIIGVVLSLIVIAAVLLLPNKESQRSKALTEMVETYAHNNSASEQEAKSVLTQLRQGGANRTASILASRGWTEKFAVGLTAAGISMKPEEYVLLTAGAGVGGGLVMFLLSGGQLAAGVLGFLIGFPVPVNVVRTKTSRRHAKFAADLPDLLTALASGLSAGASLPQALDSVSNEATGPMADELHRVLINSRLGMSVPDALEESSGRMKCADLELVVMAMRLQGMHGGNLAELLTTVSTTLRERVQMKRHVAALSAEGRLSVLVLMALPIGVLVYMALLRKDYFNYFITTGPGFIMLVVGGVMMLMGYLWSRSIVKVEV